MTHSDGRQVGASAAASTDGSAADVLLKTGSFFTRRETSPDLRAVFRQGGRAMTRSCARRTG